MPGNPDRLEIKKHPLVFFGTPGICLPFLNELHRSFDIALVITQPDALAGRNRKQSIIPAAKTFALEHHIEVLQPVNLDEPAIIEKIKAVEPEIGVVISYGQFIPKRIFSIPRYRTVNVHFSQLPQYRGAAPVQRALENGERVTGITIFEIAKKMDAGDTWACQLIPILPEDTTESLWERMSKQGAPFLVDTLEAILAGRLTKSPQDHNQATYAPAVRKEEGSIDWNLTAQTIFNKFRAFTPWPGLFCCTCEKRFKLTAINISSLSHQLSPGTVLAIDKESLKICCGNNSVLEVLEIQPEGKKNMHPYCYCRGNELPGCFS